MSGVLVTVQGAGAVLGVDGASMVLTGQTVLAPPVGVKPAFTPDEAAQAIAAARGMAAAARWRDAEHEVHRLTGVESGELADRQPVGLARLSAHLYAIGAEAGVPADEIARMLQRRFPSAETRISAMEAALRQFSGKVARDFPFRLFCEVLAEELGRDNLIVKYDHHHPEIFIQDERKVLSGILWWRKIRKQTFLKPVARVSYDSEYFSDTGIQQQYTIHLNNEFYLAHKAVIDRFLAFCMQVEERGAKLFDKSIFKKHQPSQRFFVELF